MYKARKKSRKAIQNERENYAVATAMQCQTSSIVMPRQEENCDTQTENLCSREEMLLLFCSLSLIRANGAEEQGNP